MGGMTGGMPVAFVWDTRVTLYHHSWSTETTFQYTLALCGVFVLCVMQEALYYFRTSYRISTTNINSVDAMAPLVPSRLNRCVVSQVC